VDVVSLDTARKRWTRYQARHVIAAVPMHVAARVIRDESLAPRCQAARGVLAHAPWLVANLHIGSPLDDREGAPPSWDSVLHSAAGESDALGYVDASHQSLSPIRAATVLTAYWALGRDGGDGMRAQRRELQDGSWAMWSRRVVDDLARAHPDLPERVTRADLMRWGHAMAIPRPGTRTWLQAQGLHRSAPGQRIHLAHSDLAGYSTFEEAFSFGHEAGRHVAAAIRD
jgi:hypothetical protein